MPDRKPNQGRKKPTRKAPAGRGSARTNQQTGKSPQGRKAPAKGSPVKGSPVKGSPAKGSPVKGSPAQGRPAQGGPVQGGPTPGSPPSQYDYDSAGHYTRPQRGLTAMVNVGQDFQEIHSGSATHYQDDLENRHSRLHERPSPRLDGRHSPSPDRRHSPSPDRRHSQALDGRTSPWLDGRASPGPPSMRNSPRLGDRRSARNKDESSTRDVRIEMGVVAFNDEDSSDSFNPAFSDPETSPPTSPGDVGARRRSLSDTSSISYHSSNADEDEIIDRELIAANLSNPNSVMEMLPSRQLGRTLSSAASSNKWLRKRSTKSLQRGRSMSVRHGNENIGVEMMIERILADEGEVDGLHGKKHTLNRRNTIRNLQGSLGTKRKVRAQVKKRSDRKKTKSVGMFKYWRYQTAYAWESFKERLSNLAYSAELWRAPIKKIEGNFGSGVKSYFMLLKWLLLLNIPVFILSFCFITIPQLVYLPSPSHSNPRNFTGAELLTGEGWLIETELYFGYYTNHTFSSIGSAYYNMPLAYLCASSGYLLLIFIVLAQGMSKSYRKHYITGDRQHNFYTTKVFCGWDYGITSENTSILKQRSNYLELAEHLASHHGSSERSWMTVLQWALLRLVTNLIIFGLIAAASYLIFFVYKEQAFSTDLIIIGDLAIALLVSGYNLVLPYIFSVIGFLEKYENQRTTLYVSLFRTFLMKATILIVLVYHWFNQIECAKEDAAGTLACQCWETFLGTEVYKLVIVDFFVQILSTFFLEFIRRIGRDHFCKWFASPEFDIARNTMDLIQSQTYTWIGMFFAPLLMIICIVKLILLFYIKQLSVLYNCKPSLHPWRAGIAQTLFLIILFLMYAICVGSVGYSFAIIKPSTECGPFRGLTSAFEVVTQLINQWEDTQQVWNFIITFLTTQGVVAALMVLLCLAVYYFRTVALGRLAAVKRLKQQIALEGKDKVFLLRMLQDAIRNHNSVLLSGAGTSADGADEPGESSSAAAAAEAAAAIPPPLKKGKKHAKVHGKHLARSPKVQSAMDNADTIIKGP